MIRRIVQALLAVVIFLLLMINIRLHRTSPNTGDIKRDIKKQLSFVGNELHNNELGPKMQSIYPEGEVFVYSLYGLAWCELALSSANNEKFKSEALEEALYALDHLMSNAVKSTFHKNTLLPYGAYYRGWTNYLLAKVLQVDKTFPEYEYYKSLYDQECTEIAQAMVASQTPYLESYRNLAWPADMSVLVASLAQGEHPANPLVKYQVEHWTGKVEKLIDTPTGVIGHQVNSVSGKSEENARGSSSALTLRLLAEIDREFASRQYELWNKHFVTTQFGLPAVREYPKGTVGFGDVDSGPVIFGIGFAATIVAIADLAIFNNWIAGHEQFTTIHAFGFSWNTKKEKKYLLGQVPMADAFIAWGRASSLKYVPRKYLYFGFPIFNNFTKYSLGISLLLGFAIWRLKK